MELESFKELLLKKAADNTTMQTIIGSMDDDIFLEFVMESLEKMAGEHSNSGHRANAAVTAFAKTLDDTQIDRLRDALSHHASHYKSALKNGNRALADQHLSKLVHMMHFVNKLEKHSDQRIGLRYPSLRPWEQNYTTNLSREEAHKHGLRKDPPDPNKDPHKPHEGTQGLNRRPSGSRNNNPFAVPDYRYLEMPPHPGHKDADVTDTGGYPFEKIQVGDKDTLDNKKQGFINIDDSIPTQDKYVPHIYDHHPVIKVVEKKWKQDDFAPHAEEYEKDLEKWNAHLDQGKHEADIEAAYTKNPEEFLARGTKPSKHFFEGHPLLEQPDHVHLKGHETPAATSEEPAKKSPPKKEIDFSAIPGLAHLAPKVAQAQQESAAPAPAPAKPFDFSAIPGLKPPTGKK
jgi:hypothetical protein